MEVNGVTNIHVTLSLDFLDWPFPLLSISELKKTQIHFILSLNSGGIPKFRETFPKYKNLGWKVCESVELGGWGWRWIFLLNLTPESELLGFDKERKYENSEVHKKYFFSLGHVTSKI